MMANDARPKPPLVPPEGGVARELARMCADHRPPERPVLVVGGWRAPRISAWRLARHLASLTGAPADRFGACGIALCWSIESATARVLREARASWGDAPLDVVAISMGGLVARSAAIEGLAIRRLFTLGTPHRGARLAPWFPIDASTRAMRPGSAFLARLDAALPTAGYELVCYARLRDSWVGATRTAPPGRGVIWKPGPLLLSHHTIALDRLIVADIARRLRGDTALATEATAPPAD
ncbi:MAG: esterase/lipase family protein [Phycisphaerales bacterium]